MKYDIQGIELEVGDGVAFNPCRHGTHVLLMGRIEKLTPKGMRIVWIEKHVQKHDYRDYETNEVITPKGQVTFQEYSCIRTAEQVCWIDGNGRA